MKNNKIISSVLAWLLGNDLRNIFSFLVLKFKTLQCKTPAEQSVKQQLCRGDVSQSSGLFTSIVPFGVPPLFVSDFPVHCVTKCERETYRECGRTQSLDVVTAVRSGRLWRLTWFLKRPDESVTCKSVSIQHLFPFNDTDKFDIFTLDYRLYQSF